MGRHKRHFPRMSWEEAKKFERSGLPEPKSPTTSYSRLMDRKAKKLKKGTWVNEVGGGLPGSKR
jgi:hypothetical protein